jgi:hypothetical protein
MVSNYRSQRRGITIPELTGVIACVGVGLIAGGWMFLNRTAPSDDRPALRNSTDAATSAPTLSQEEADLRAIQRKIIKEIEESKAHRADNDEPAIAFDPNQKTIAHSDVRSLLGERKPTPHGAAKTSSKKTQSRGANAAIGSNGPQTLAFWNAMNNVMAEEETMRATPAGGLTKENAADFIARRGQAGNYAATELRGLDRAGVDPEVVALGTDIAAWYERGTKLNDRASYLVNQASDETRRGQTGKSWGDSEKSHNASVAEINRRGDALRVKMSHKYGLKFPDLR